MPIKTDDEGKDERLAFGAHLGAVRNHGRTSGQF